MSLKFFLSKKEDLKKGMSDIVALCETEDRAWTDEEEVSYNSLKSEYVKISNQIAALQGFPDEDEAEIEVPAEPARSSAVAVKAMARNFVPGDRKVKEFNSLNDFVHAAMYNPDDSRLEYQESQSNDLKMGVGAKGGFTIPTQFLSEIKSIAPTASIVRPRATVIPAGTPPDAEISMPALDQEPSGSTNQVYGGVIVEKVEEGGLKPETTLNFREIKLKPYEVAARIPMTDKLLRNSSAAAAFVAGQLSKAVLGWEDYQFLQGNGVAGPLGAINSGAALVVARTTSSSVTFADIRALEERLHGESGIFIASRSVKAQLLAMTGDGGGATNVIAYDRTTNTLSLYGRPVLFSDRVPGLGTQGDLGLYNFSEYLIKDGSGPIIETGFATGQWERNKRSVKITWNVDGQPWLTKPYRDENNYEVSPFVILGDAVGS
jgi:HK97 family phage major capsid protein